MDVHSDIKTMTAAFRPLVRRIQRRLEGEQGFTLIELMIVLLTMGILLTIAVPSYLSFKDKANRTAAKQDLSQAFRAVQSYNADNVLNSRNDPDGNLSNSGFEGLSLQALSTKYDASIDANALTSPFVTNPIGFSPTPAKTDFCLTATIGRWTAAQRGLNGTVSVGTLFTAGTCTAT